MSFVCAALWWSLLLSHSHIRHMDLVLFSGWMYATTQHLAFRVDLVAAPAYKSYGLKNLLRKVNTTARLLKRDVSHTEAGI